MLTTKALVQPVAKPSLPNPGLSNPPVAQPNTASAKASSPQLRFQRPDASQENPLRKLAFYSGLGMLFLRFGVIPELMLYLTGINFYLLYIFGPPAILGGLVTGAVQRTFRHKAAWLWTGFLVWMIIAVPFSSWVGGSTQMVLTYGRTDFAFLFVIGGLATNWKEVRAIFYTIAAAAVANLVTAQIFMKTDMGGRFSIEASGTIGNANDLAAHLILVMPFLLFVILDPRRSSFIRIPLLLAVPYALWVILGTGSRGAFVALGVTFIFALFMASPGQRLAVLAGTIMMAVIVPLLLPGLVLTRLGSVFGQDHKEAEESGASREYLLRQSLIFSAENPIFGVGPDQFSNFEGKTRLSEGRRGNWHVTHNTWTQVSSECGIPALIFFVLAIGSSLQRTYKTYREARKKGFKEIANACFCFLLGMVGYLSAITFLSGAYKFYLPAMIGLSCSLSYLATKHMQTANSGLTPARVR